MDNKEGKISLLQELLHKQIDFLERGLVVQQPYYSSDEYEKMKQTLKDLRKSVCQLIAARDVQMQELIDEIAYLREMNFAGRTMMNDALDQLKELEQKIKANG